MDLKDIIRDSSLPRSESELLLAFILDKSREFLLAHPETRISPTDARRFKSLEAKRLTDWPIAYLTGTKGFYGYDFRVSPAVLTPRPETEKIVEDIVAIAKEMKDRKPVIIDVGTGSGAIIISIAKELKRLSPVTYRHTEFLATDISDSALNIAKKNAAKHGLAAKIKFAKGNLLAPLKLDKRKLDGSELIIAANLPYLTKKQIKGAPSISQEPMLALDGGPDGLKYYRRLFQQLSPLRGFNSLRIICEIDDSQARGIKALTDRYFPAVRSKIIRDLSGKKRFLAF